MLSMAAMMMFRGSLRILADTYELSIVRANMIPGLLTSLPGLVTIEGAGQNCDDTLMHLNMLLKRVARDRVEKLEMLSGVFGRQIDSTKDLTLGEAVALFRLADTNIHKLSAELLLGMADPIA